ncbi:MAG: acyl carrier protein [Oscillospiraceae bacterium]|nr:acyl carrier protein [Oscillospiraceae bacterium]
MIFKRVCEMIAEQFGLDEESITMDTLFQEDLSADSLDLVELTMAIEEEFEIGEIEDEDLVELRSVGDVVNYIMNKRGEN